MLILEKEIIGFFDEMLYPEEKPLLEAVSEISELIQNRQIRRADVVLSPDRPEPTEVRIFLKLVPIEHKTGTLWMPSDDLFITAKIENTIPSILGVEADTMLAVGFRNESSNTEVTLSQAKDFYDQGKLSTLRTLEGKTIKGMEFREHDSESELRIGFEDGSLFLLKSRTQPAVLRFEGSEKGIFRKVTLSKSRVVA